MLLKALAKIYVAHSKRDISILSTWTFVFSAHLNFPRSTAKTVMWWRFGWRSGWVTKQSRLMFPARGVRECFMLPYWDRKLRGKQRESQTLTRKLHSAVLYSPHRDSCVYLLFFFFFSVSPLNTHTHIHTLAHGCITNILSTHVHAPSLIPSVWDEGLLYTVRLR